MSRPEYGSDLHLWPAKPEVSPLRDHEHEWTDTDLGAKGEEGQVVAQRCQCGDERVIFRTPHAVARSTDPGTSWEAARSITPENLTWARDTVLRALQDLGPMTDERLCAFLEADMSPSGARSRRSELVAMGLVRDSGRKDTLRSGRRAIVWEAV